MAIKLRFSTIDGLRYTKTFKTLNGAQKAAQYRLGETPEMGSTYAVAADGVIKVVAVDGCTLAELFPATTR